MAFSYGEKPTGRNRISPRVLLITSSGRGGRKGKSYCCYSKSFSGYRLFFLRLYVAAFPAHSGRGYFCWYLIIDCIYMRNESLVSITDYSKEDILEVLENARHFEENPNRRLLEGKVVATLFFEPSTRTRLSFETAVNRLGGRVIGFSDASTTSSTKGETLKDTIMMVSNYVDLIIMRHYLDGAARYASEVSCKPIINAGDGANQHPSQTMLDLYSIYKTQGKLDGLNITMVSDLKYGRTVHSLIMAMSHFSPTFHFVAPDELKIPDDYKKFCDSKGIKYYEHDDTCQCNKHRCLCVFRLR